MRRVPDVVVPAIAQVLAGAAAERVVDKALRGLNRDERAAAADAIFGVALWRRRLRWQVGADATPAQLLEAYLGGLAPEPPGPADRWSVPDWLAELAGTQIPDPESFFRVVNQRGPICLRANRLRCTREELAARLSWATHAGALAKDALIVEERAPNLFGSDAWREGWFEPQDEGSQLVGLLVQAQPGDSVLDYCAGAGGKTLLLAAETHGEIFAHDVDAARLERLQTRAERAGARVRIGARPADKVLVDAPCSELGTLRRGPDARWRIQLDPELPRQQLAILDQAAGFARKRLVYATCTFTREENEDVAAAFEARHPEWRRDQSLRLWPHLHGTDAFFAVAWNR